MRSAIYLRLSVETDESTSPQRQREVCEEFVRAQGWTYDPEKDRFEDLGRSGYSARRRPSFERLREHVRNGVYDRVVVYRLDRLSRDWSVWAELLSNRQTDVAFYSATEGINSRTDRFTVGILALVAEQESRNTSERVKSARTALFAQGRWPGGNRPFGWTPQPHPSGQGLILGFHETERAYLREAIDKMLDGHSSASIVADWNARGITTAQGKAWWQSALTRLLRSPLLLGYRVEGGSPVTGPDGLPLQVWDALVTHEEWEQLQARLGKRAAVRSRHDGALLTGLLRCAECGCAMTGPANPTLLSDVYRCPSRQARGQSTCPGVSISALRLNELATDVGLELVDPRRLDPRTQPRARPDGDTEKAAQLRVALERLEEAHFMGTYEDLDGERRYRQLRAKWTGELNALLAKSPQQPEPIPSGEVLWEFLDGIPSLFNPEGRTRAEVMHERWLTLTRVQQREVLAAGIKTIRITKFRGTQKGVPRSSRNVRGRVLVEPRSESFEGRVIPLPELWGELLWGAYEGPDELELMSDDDRAYLAHVLSHD